MHIIIVTLQTYIFVKQLLATCSNNINERSISRIYGQKYYLRNDFMLSFGSRSEKDTNNLRSNELKRTLESSQNNNNISCTEENKSTESIIYISSEEEDFSKEVKNGSKSSLNYMNSDQNTSKVSDNLYLSDHRTDSNFKKFYQDETPNPSQFPNNFLENRQAVFDNYSKLKNMCRPSVRRKIQFEDTSIDSTLTIYQNNLTDSFENDAIGKAEMRSYDDEKKTTLEIKNFNKQNHAKKSKFKIIKPNRECVERPNKEELVNREKQEFPCDLKTDIPLKQPEDSKGSDLTSDCKIKEDIKEDSNEIYEFYYVHGNYFTKNQRRLMSAENEK